MPQNRSEYYLDDGVDNGANMKTSDGHWCVLRLHGGTSPSSRNRQLSRTDTHLTSDSDYITAYISTMDPEDMGCDA